MKPSNILWYAFSFALLFPSKSYQKPVADDRPNVLFILVDDLSFGAITPNGNRFQQMPAIEKLVSEGVSFSDAYVMPQCTPTRASLLTGQHTARNEMWHVIPGYSYPYATMKEPVFRRDLPRNTHLFSKSLQKNGYKTAFLGKWHLTANDDGHYLYLNDRAKHHYGFDYVNPTQEPYNYAGIGDKGVNFLTEEAIQFMEESVAENKPFFVMLSHHTVHNPVLAPDTLVNYYKERGWPLENRLNEKISYPTNANYLAALKHLDNSVSRLTEALSKLEITQNTIVFFLSDNGGIDAHLENYPLRYGKGSPFEGGIRVPLIISWPGKIQSGSVSSEPVHVVDVYPTILEMTQSQPEVNHVLDGLSLLPHLINNTRIKRETLCWYMPIYDMQWGASPCAVIRQKEYKLIHFFGDYIDLEDGGKYVPGTRDFLFHLKTDQSESENLVDSLPLLTDQMKVDLFQWLEAMEVELPSKNPSFNLDSVRVISRSPEFK